MNSLLAKSVAVIAAVVGVVLGGLYLIGSVVLSLLPIILGIAVIAAIFG